MIAARDWWRTADAIEVAIADAMWWIEEAVTAADLLRIVDGAFPTVFLVDRLKRLVSKGIVEVVDSRKMRGVTVRRYRLAGEVR